MRASTVVVYRLQQNLNVFLLLVILNPLLLFIFCGIVFPLSFSPTRSAEDLKYVYQISVPCFGSSVSVSIPSLPK